MENIVPKKYVEYEMYDNALTLPQPFPFANIFLDNIPLEERVDNSPLNARERVDIAIIRFLYRTHI